MCQSPQVSEVHRERLERKTRFYLLTELSAPLATRRLHMGNFLMLSRTEVCKWWSGWELLSLAIWVAIPVCARLFLSLEAATLSLLLLYTLEYAYNKDLPYVLTIWVPHFLQPIPWKSTPQFTCWISPTNISRSSIVLFLCLRCIPLLHCTDTALLRALLE